MVARCPDTDFLIGVARWTHDGVAEAPLGHLGHLGGAQDQLAVAQHTHRVGDGGHLPQLVQHHEDRDAVGSQAPQPLEERLGGGWCQESGGFVQQQDGGLGCQRPDDFQRLAGLHGEVADARRQGRLAAHLGHVVLPALLEVDAAVDGAASRPGGGQFERLGHGERRRQREVLVHHRQAGGLGGADIAGWDLPAGDLDVAGVGHLQAAQHLGERRLARPVLADEGVDAPGRQLEADVVQRPDGAEGDAERPAANRRGPGGSRSARRRHRLEISCLRVRG